MDPHEAHLRQFERNSHLRSLVKEARKRAKLKRLPFDLDFEWLEKLHTAQNGRCALTGIEFVTRRRKHAPRNPYAPSIDRINSRLGYTKKNCRLVCCAANLALGEWGEGVFRQMAYGYLRIKWP